MNNVPQMERSRVEDRVEQALEVLYHRDKFLLEHNASEWCVAHKFAEYLQRSFRSYHVDCEYNREGWNVPKELSNLPECETEDVENPKEKERKVRPDIIVHERGHNRRNLIAIEIKLGYEVDAECDWAKLRELTRGAKEFKYSHGLYFRLPVKDAVPDREITAKWYRDGEEVSCRYPFSDQ